MSIPFSGLKAKYEEISALFIDEVNKTTMTVYYDNPNSPTPTNQIDGYPQVLDEYGGRMPLDHIADHQGRSGTGYIIEPLSESFLVRAYWNPKKDANMAGIQDPQNVCKVITYVNDESKIINATHAELNDRPVKILYSPVRYGLFGAKQYSCSYWRVI